ncbi:hypothetical protein [Ancylobacter sp.]|uniref:hypothetical protein n=1 Tax=Ancylobacter sp. TaxID=1872567 RepID=UPI003D14D864
MIANLYGAPSLFEAIVAITGKVSSRAKWVEWHENKVVMAEAEVERVRARGYRWPSREERAVSGCKTGLKEALAAKARAEEQLAELRRVHLVHFGPVDEAAVQRSLDERRVTKPSEVDQLDHLAQEIREALNGARNS